MYKTNPELSNGLALNSYLESFGSFFKGKASIRETHEMMAQLLIYMYIATKDLALQKQGINNLSVR